MIEEAQLRRTLRAQDLNDWSVLGDQLIERGDRRGELIAMECQLAGDTSPTGAWLRDRMITALVDAYGDALLPDALTEPIRSARWRMGGLEHIACGWQLSALEALLEHPVAAGLQSVCLIGTPKELPRMVRKLAQHGVRTLELRRLPSRSSPKALPAWLSAVIETEDLGALRSLSLPDAGLNVLEVGALLRRANLTNLERLDLSGNELTLADLRTLLNALAMQPKLRALLLSENRLYWDLDAPAKPAAAPLNLTSIDLNGSNLSGRVISSLIESGLFSACDHLNLSASTTSAQEAHEEDWITGFPNLRVLDLSDTVFGRRNTQALLKAPWPRLEALLLSGTRGLQSPKLIEFAGRSDLPKLRALDLRGHRLTKAASIAILSGIATQLDRLNLSETGLTDAHLTQQSAVELPATELNLSNNRISDAGLLALSRNLKAPRLRRLNLSGNSLSRVSIDAIFEAWPTLQILELSRCGLKAPAGTALASATPCALAWLNLAGNMLGDEGVAALCQGDWSALLGLDLSTNALTDASAASLANAPSLPRLARLELTQNEISGDGRASLSASSHLSGAIQARHLRP